MGLMKNSISCRCRWLGRVEIDTSCIAKKQNIGRKINFVKIVKINVKCDKILIMLTSSTCMHHRLTFLS
jgi:hypothetical protein